jgi:hypothetical protein
LILRALQLAGVAAIFAISGAWSYWYLIRGSSGHLFPVPFCMLALLLFLRQPAGLLAAPREALDWPWQPQLSTTNYSRGGSCWEQ